MEANGSNGARFIRHLGWPILALLIFIMIASIGLPALAILISPGADVARITGAIAQGNSIARVVALVTVVPSIVVLAATDKINGAAAIAALSAIAGYVLGGSVPSVQ